MFQHPRQRTTAISIWILGFSLGGAIGPLLGGIMLEHFWWGSVFLINVPVMALILITGPMLLPEYRDPSAGKPDITSAVLSLAAVLTMIYGLKRIAQDGLTVTAVMFIVVGLALGVSFVRRQRRLPDPLIDLRLFRIPAFRASLVMYGGCILNMFGGFLFLPQYLQFVLGLSPLRAGIWTLPWASGFIIGSLATPALGRRIRPAVLLSLGLTLSAAGYFMLAGVRASAEPLLLFALATFILSLGASPVYTLTNDIIIGSAPPERAGAASGISETCAEFGGALGIAFFGSIGVAVYRGVLGQTLPPGLSPEVTNAAMSTLGGAFAISRQLPAQVGAALIDAANDAFLRGLVLCSAISGVGSIGLAIFASVTFRGAGTAPQRTGEHRVEAVA
jgi:DHA2 family multidrug resistance protein-like MFS transporter